MKKIYKDAWEELREALNNVRAGTPRECLDAVEEIIEDLESMREGLRSDLGDEE